ncbi:hypothetical protein DRN73_07215 [Candidatus Pacearchaeota archaeon]|nr:MAG: hypothetical protein DRN73_07215 [Candidatus Pacearchaeota archaeon]
MKINIEKSKLKENKESLYNFMRRCGYMPFHNSYIRPLTAFGYPRFHLYIIEETEFQYIFCLHLDQKKPSYGKETAHSGEYEGKVVEEEAKRIKNNLYKKLLSN